MTPRALALALCLAAQPLAAQAFDMASRDTSGPIEVSADNGIEWSQDKQQFIARGNARASRGGMSVTADTLTAHYRNGPQGDTEIYRIDAVGNVVIASPGETATGTSASYDMDAARMVLKGTPAKLVTPTDSVTANDSIEYEERGQTAVARGEAVASRADRRIRADVLTARFKEDARGQLVLRRAEATGRVVLTTARDVVTGDKGDYDAESGIATLTGSVKITRDDNQLNGGYAQVNLNTGISKLFAAAPGSAGGQRVQGLFVPQSDAQEGAAAGARR